MPSTAGVAYNKEHSEARALINSLQLRGHKRSDIAHAIGVPPKKLTTIWAGGALGDDVVTPLKGLLATLPDVAHAPKPDAPKPDAPMPTSEPTGGPLPLDLREVEAPANAPAPTPGLGERLKALMLGSGDAASGASAAVTPPPLARAAKASDKQGAFVAQVLPIVALCVAWGAELAIREPYKPVGPTVEEATAMLAVPIRRVAQQLDIRGHLTENTMDAVMMLLAVAAYGRRAHSTYQTIREREAYEHDDSHGQTAQGGTHPGQSPDTRRTPASGGSGANSGFAAVQPDTGRTTGGHYPGAGTAHDARARGAASHPGQPGRGGLFGRGGSRSDAGRAAPNADSTVHGADAGERAQPTGANSNPMADVLRADYEGRLRLGSVG